MTAPSAPRELPPQVIILDMLLGMMKTQAIHEAVRLNLAERLKDGPKSLADLASETKTNPNALMRLLRTLESLGLFTEVEAGYYGQSALSHFLRPGVPGSMHDVAFIHGEEWQWRPWEGFSHSMETGQAAFNHLFHTTLFEYFSTHPIERERFNKAMAGFSNQVDAPLAQGYDYSPLGTIVDIGGGYGGLLRAILRANPQLRGTLFDLPQVVEDTRQQVAPTEEATRYQLIAGDMFQPEQIPQGADAYIMKQIIKDWDDTAAVLILDNCRKAMRPGGKVLVAEQVLLPGQTMVPAKLIDLQLMVVASGQERNEAQYRALFEAAGLDLVKIWPTHSPYSILEGVAR